MGEKLHLIIHSVGITNNRWNSIEKHWEPEIAHFDIERANDQKRGFFYCYNVNVPLPPGPLTTPQYIAWASERGKAYGNLIHQATFSVDGTPVLYPPSLSTGSIFYENDEFILKNENRTIGSAGEQLDDYK